MTPWILLLLILHSTSAPCMYGDPDDSLEDNTVLSIWGGFDALPGGAGGEIWIQAGANRDIGDGRDGDLTASTRLASGERFYRQVTAASIGPYMIEPLTVTVAGKVTIHCQYLFHAYVLLESGADLTIIAGQPLWVSSSPMPFMGTELEALATSHSVMFANSTPGPCRFQFYTTAHGDIRDIGFLDASGGDADDLAIEGGNGGTLTINNDLHDVYLGTVSAGGGQGCDSHGPDETRPGSRGGAGGRLAIRAKTIHLASPILGVLASGGAGGDGALWQLGKSVTDGGNGGDGGKVLLEAEAIEIPGFGWPGLAIVGTAAIVADGGAGGRGGDSYDPAIAPADGGDGGAPGLVQFHGATTTSVSTRPGEGGKGGEDRQRKVTGAAGKPGSGISSVQPPALPERTEDEWTIMTYMAADNEMECFWNWGRLDWDCYSTERDWIACLDAMEETCFSDTPVNVLIQMDRYQGRQGELSIPKSAAGTWGYWDDTRRGFLTYDGASGISTVLTPVIEGGSELNTGTPKPLVDFVTWARRVAPAKHEMLVLCGHGGGWAGFLHDARSSMTWTGGSAPYADRVEMDELQTALTAIGKVDVLFVHTCLGASLEAITSAAGHADFYLATEESIDRKSFWDTWYPEMAIESNIAPADLARRIVNTWGGTEAFCLCDLSVIDQINRSIRVFVDRICHSSTPASEAETRRLWEAAVAALANTNDLSFGNRDLVHFMHELRLKAWGAALDEADLPVTIRDVCRSALDVVAAVRAATPVVAGENAEWASGRNLSGVSVYLPERNEDGSKYSVNPHYEARAKAGRIAFARDTGWLEFITALTAHANGP